jgi:hypothetical protein
LKNQQLFKFGFFGEILMEKLFVYRIHSIKSIRFIENCNKYVATLQIRNRPKFEVWLTPKQADNLNNSFGINDFSNKNNTVYAVLAKEKNKTRFVWSATNDQDKKYLCNKFGAVEPDENNDDEVG